MAFAPIFEPLTFRHLTLKNRVFRSNVSGRFDFYDGSGSHARVNWETRFARGGVGAIVSSFVPVHVRGRILPNYAMIDDDRHIPFWRAVGTAVHDHDCRFILQLSHGGRQRDIPGIDYPVGLSSTSRPDPMHGFPCEAMTLPQIRETVAQFADGARRAREAGLDGVELHAANGYLFTQFLSSAINDRTDDYGGPLENRARFLLDVVAAIRRDGRHRLPPAGEAEHPGVPGRRRVLREGPVGQHRRGVDPGLQVARGRRRRRPPRLDRRLLPPSAQSGWRRPAARRPGHHLRCDGVERRPRAAQPAAVQAAPRPRHETVERRRAAAGPDRGGPARRRAPGQGGSRHSGDLHRRLPERVGGGRRARTRRLRRGEHRPVAHRQQRPGAQSGRTATIARSGRAPTATGAWPTSSRTRSAATTRPGSRRARR